MKSITLVLLLSSMLSSTAMANSIAETALTSNLPSEVAQLEAQNKEELSLLGSNPYRDVFPKGYDGSFDPINKKRYQKSKIGRVFKTTNPFLDYDYYRYKTVYNVRSFKERMANLPYHYEACHEDNYSLANWSESRTVTVTVEAGVSFEYLGFGASVGASVSEGVTISTTRSVKATLGVEAKHYPYKASEEWEGITYIQTYTKKSGKVQYLLPSWSDMGMYPYSFFLDNQNVGFEVKREVLKTCPEYQNKESSQDDPRF